jgi:hypothetical protein
MHKKLLPLKRLLSLGTLMQELITEVQKLSAHQEQLDDEYQRHLNKHQAKLNENQRQLNEHLDQFNKRQNHLEQIILQGQRTITPDQMAKLSHHFYRNFLTNDDSAVQKNLIATWRLGTQQILSYSELTESGFRVFSQNDEDGLLLRLFAHIGCTNRHVIEIGSNCSGSEVGIPENISTNLIVNHGWHGVIFEIDPIECDRLRYYFARNHATRHFHWTREDHNHYYSPKIVCQAVDPENINQLLLDANKNVSPDLMVIDIDGGDYSVVNKLQATPRVLVVEFEKRFRDHYSVVQFDRTNFGKNWRQSGGASLPAWEKLLNARGYTLCAIAICGFNAFFVRSDVASGKIAPLTSREAFDNHPIFSRIDEDFWLAPDDTWQEV